MDAWAVLLRGVNVGGRGTLAMTDFARVLAELGCSDVRTYLQSGNAVLTTDRGAGALAAAVRHALSAATGRDVEVLVRSAADLGRVAAGWPFPGDAPPTARHVTFLERPVAPAALGELLEEGLGAERVAARGAELYLWLPAGMGRSKLAPLVARRLGGLAATTRNWNTVGALAEQTARLARAAR